VIIATYIAMLLTSIALGYLVFRFFSEPLNRKLRDPGRQPKTFVAA